MYSRRHDRDDYDSDSKDGATGAAATGAIATAVVEGIAGYLGHRLSRGRKECECKRMWHKEKKLVFVVILLLMIIIALQLRGFGYV
jgi:hypothetical protein